MASGSSSSSMESVWSRASDVSLMEYMQRKRCLWDPNEPEYGEQSVREATLEDIAASLSAHPDLRGVTGEHVWLRFMKMQTHFQQQMKKSTWEIVPCVTDVPAADSTEIHVDPYTSDEVIHQSDQPASCVSRKGNMFQHLIPYPSQLEDSTSSSSLWSDDAPRPCPTQAAKHRKKRLPKKEKASSTLVANSSTPLKVISYETGIIVQKAMEKLPSDEQMPLLFKIAELLDNLQQKHKNG